VMEGGGCACSVARSSRTGETASLVSAALAAVWFRRRQQPVRPVREQPRSRARHGGRA